MNTEQEETDKTYPTISDPVTWADLEKIPVATPDMTEEELRQICVDYMELMTGIVWTPDQTVSFDYPSAYSSDDDGKLHLEEGTLYGGVPYTQAAANLESFLDYYDETTGVLKLAGIENTIHQRLGNNCGTAVFWAWQRVSSTIDYYGTRQMCLAHGCIPVGSYTYDSSLPDFRQSTSTRDVCQDNGEDVMMASYALLKPGDGVTMTIKGIGGHARMVKEVSVTPGSVGGVDPEKSYVICLEQASHGGNRQTDDGFVYGIGSEHRYSFTNLYEKGYLPVTVAELCGKAPVKKAEASLTEVNSLQDLTKATLSATYCISRADIVIRDENGEEVLTAFREGTCITGNQYVMQMEKVLSLATLSRQLEKGKTFNVTVTARLGNGETLTVFSGALSY